MRIPIAVRALDEPDTAFGETPCEQTLASVGGRLGIVKPIERPSGGGFAIESQQLGSFRLHAKGQLERFDAGFEGLVGAGAREMTGIHFMNQIELLALEESVLLRIVQIIDRGFLQGSATAANGRSMMHRGQKSTCP